MIKETNRLLLRRISSILLVFITYPFAQNSTFSSEAYSFEARNPYMEEIPLFVQSNFNIISDKVVNPYFFRLAYQQKILKPNEKISTNGVLTALHLARFLHHHNPRISFDRALFFAGQYAEKCRLEGINHDIAFAQMCLETGYLRFGGVVLPEQNNFSGLGAVNDNTPGDYFQTPEIGITAHVQHLKAYASKDDLKTKLVDKRYRFVERGSATSVQDLTGKWATDPQYGQKIIQLLHRMYSF